MPRSNLQRKSRKPKSNEDLARRNASKTALAKILIVCEGKKTEPKYFEDLISYYGLQTASVIDITGECGSSPMSVYKHAKDKYKEASDKGAPYDRVYVVIDKDAHTDYKAALDAVSRSRPGKTWFTANSVPCFEFWLLLHFTYTTKSYMNLPGNSSGDQIVSELKKHIKNYAKGSSDIFAVSFGALKSGSLQEVIIKSKKACTAADDSQTDNPSTYIHELVEFLLGLHAQMQKNLK